MSLYRTYRPKTFADVAGQEHIVTTLSQAVAQDQLSHAYLFAGTRGTGKTSIARILARVLLTRGIEDTTLRDHILRAAEDGNLVDLTEIDAASNRGIDDIRSLLEKIQFTPVVAKAKVYIIDEVHMLTREAFNALLKTLEEPPPYAYFILATTELHKIPPTIQSRCQRYLFRQIREEDLILRLQFIAEQEQITIEPAALRAIAHSVQGSMRDAVSLLDQLRSLPAITLADVKQRIGETGHEYLEQIWGALQKRDAQEVMRLIRAIEEAAVPLETFVRLLLGSVRSSIHQSIDRNENPALHLRMLETLLMAVKDLRNAPVPGLVLESALLSLCIPEGSTLEPSQSPAASAPTQPPKPTPLPPIPTVPSVPTIPSVPSVPSIPSAPSSTAEQILAPELSIEAIRRAWPGVIDQVEPAFVRMSLKNGQLLALEDMTVLIAFSSAFHRDKASSVEGGRSAEEALERIFHRPVRLKCVLDTDRQSAPAPATAERVNLAEAAMEIF